MPQAALEWRGPERAARVANSFEVVAREWFGKYSPMWADSHAEKIRQRLERDIYSWIGERPSVKSPRQNCWRFCAALRTAGPSKPLTGHWGIVDKSSGMQSPADEMTTQYRCESDFEIEPTIERMVLRMPQIGRGTDVWVQ